MSLLNEDIDIKMDFEEVGVRSGSNWFSILPSGTLLSI
jgi:hypothetical protein